MTLSLDSDVLVKDQLPALKALILGLAIGETSKLEELLESKDLQGLELETVFKCQEHFFFPPKKRRTIWLIWAYLFPEAFGYWGDAVKVTYCQHLGWDDMNPWGVTIPLKIKLPLGARALLNQRAIELEVLEDQRYYKWRSERDAKRAKAKAPKTDTGSEAEFEFID